MGDCGLCILTCLLPCVTFGQNAEKAGQGSCLTCALAYYCCNVACLLAGWMRGKVQEKVGQPASGLIVNCCVHCWCHRAWRTTPHSAAAS